jgi:hypothetical protein
MRKKTNNKMLRELVEEFKNDEFMSALLRERIVIICQMTIEDIEENPKGWERTIVSPKAFIQLNEKVTKIIGYNN